VAFDGSIKLECHGSTVASDAGLPPYRELDEAMGPTAMVEGLPDDRRVHCGGGDAGASLLNSCAFFWFSL
jgi:hypothetical protein